MIAADTVSTHPGFTGGLGVARGVDFQTDDADSESINLECTFPATERGAQGFPTLIEFLPGLTYTCVRFAHGSQMSGRLRTTIRALLLAHGPAIVTIATATATAHRPGIATTSTSDQRVQGIQRHKGLFFASPNAQAM